jgi:aryl-alcohol dehydrogenase-like predicted oxidoreductase
LLHWPVSNAQFPEVVAGFERLRAAGKIRSWGVISSDDCRTRAVECYQAAQNATDYDARRALLGLAVQWLELASQMESVNSDDKSSSPTDIRFH